MQVMAAAPRNGQSRPEKRHIKNFSLAEKVSAIDRVHGGESKASVARDIGVAESTLRGWCKSEHKIRSQYNNLAIGMGPRHSPVNIGRSMSANGRKSLATPDEDAPVAKKAKIDRTSRQNIPQTILPGPSTSLAGSFIGHNYNSDYAAALFAPMISSAQQNICTIWPTLDIMSRNYVSFAENGLQYTWTNNTTLPTIASSTIVSNSAINTSSIDGVRNTMGNMIGNVMGNALDYTTGNRNIAVASTQGISSSYTRKSPSMTPAADASTTPASASSLPKKANCTRESKKTNIDLALSGNNIIGNIKSVSLEQSFEQDPEGEVNGDDDADDVGIDDDDDDAGSDDGDAANDGDDGNGSDDADDVDDDGDDDGNGTDRSRGGGSRRPDANCYINFWHEEEEEEEEEAEVEVVEAAKVVEVAEALEVVEAGAA
ncbi:transcription initiation factor TFIID subunit 11-like, partial [Odontomachus brunneus]|uniref:transcription initiation factor TFIID subunit 11-like n=1 Tax=Odontomachus brunneus TaxID=486640 RepID=UPI0013F23AC3